MSVLVQANTILPYFIIRPQRGVIGSEQIRFEANVAGATSNVGTVTLAYSPVVTIISPPTGAVECSRHGRDTRPSRRTGSRRLGMACALVERNIGLRGRSPSCRHHRFAGHRNHRHATGRKRLFRHHSARCAVVGLRFFLGRPDASGRDSFDGGESAQRDPSRFGNHRGCGSRQCVEWHCLFTSRSPPCFGRRRFLRLRHIGHVRGWALASRIRRDTRRALARRAVAEPRAVDRSQSRGLERLSGVRRSRWLGRREHRPTGRIRARWRK